MQSQVSLEERDRGRSHTQRRRHVTTGQLMEGWGPRGGMPTATGVRRGKEAILPQRLQGAHPGNTSISDQ